MMAQKSFIQKAAQGDMQAFCKLVSTFQEEVFRLCYYYSGNEEAAYNLAADSFKKVRNAIPLYPESEDFHLWLIRIVCNTCRVSKYRKSDNVSALAAALRTRMQFSEADTAYVLDLSEDALKEYDLSSPKLSSLHELSGTHDLASCFQNSLKAEKQERSPLKVLSHFRFTILAILIVLIILLVSHIRSASSESAAASIPAASTSDQEETVTDVPAGEFLPGQTASTKS